MLPCIYPAAPSGSDITRAGTKTSASGQVTGASSKKALGESLDTAVANLNKDACKEKKGKAPKGGKTSKKTTRVTDESKKLQKDIKAFLVLMIHLKLPWLVLFWIARLHLRTHN